MKYLINVDLKALRQGEYVKADPKAGEFILDSDDQAACAKLNKATIAGIAESHGFKMPATTKQSELLAALFSNLNNLELPTMSQKTEQQIVEEIVAAGVAAGKTDDQMLIDIVNKKVSFKVASRLFKQVMEAQGHRVSNKARKEQAADVIAKLKFAPKEWADVEAAAKKLSESIKDTNERKAIAILRNYAKQNKIAMPQAPKKEKVAGGFKGAMFGWMVANPKATDAEFTAFMTSKKKGEKAVKRFLPFMDTVRKVHAAATKK